jgi:hypothetical protein
MPAIIVFTAASRMIIWSLSGSFFAIVISPMRLVVGQVDCSDAAAAEAVTVRVRFGDGGTGLSQRSLVHSLI